MEPSSPKTTKVGKGLAVVAGHCDGHIPLDDAVVGDQEVPPELGQNPQPGQHLPGHPGIAGSHVRQGLHGLVALALGVADLDGHPEGARPCSSYFWPSSRSLATTSSMTKSGVEAPAVTPIRSTPWSQAASSSAAAS